MAFLTIWFEWLFLIYILVDLRELPDEWKKTLTKYVYEL